METKIINGLKVVYNNGFVIVTLALNTLEQLKEFLLVHEDAIVLVKPSPFKSDEFTLVADNFDFLNKLNLKRIILSQVGIWIKDYSGLYTQIELVRLIANTIDNADFDFSNFKKLEVVEFYWTPKTKSFFSCASLKDVRIWKYKAAGKKNLEEFASLKNIQRIELIQSNIISIAGVEKLKYLSNLAFSYNLNLEINADELDFVLPHVEELEINTCRKVDLGFVRLFPNLKKLVLVKFQDIRSLKPILDGFSHLEELFVGETKIEEWDNTYYLNYKNIKRFFFDEKKYHKLKNKDIGKDW